MTPEEVLAALGKVAARRIKADAAAREAEEEEKALIAEAWRAGLGPVQIAEAASRSQAHARKFRPDDVEPLRKGGMWAVKNAPKKRTRRTK